MASLSSHRILRYWLLLSTGLIFTMIAVGGLTRLTRSGLSIVEWKPVSGVLPPLNDEQWQEEFEKYKQFPEYQKVNQGMLIDDFKVIFYWEFFHRLLGRLIGLVFAVPLLVFALRGYIKGRLAVRLCVALILGGCQGALGWFMVQSGLVDIPRVSAYRLAAHLGLALFLMSLLFWTAQDLRAQFRVRRSLGYLPQLTQVFLTLIAFQIFYGALTAGLHAGHLYNTFPTMNGLWIPPGLTSMEGVIQNLFENPVTVQFIHRTLGWLILFSALGLVITAERSRHLSRTQRLSIRLIFAMVVVQFTIGVLTLLHAVPVVLGSLHQVGACILLLLSVYAAHAFRQTWLKTAAPVRQHYRGRSSRGGRRR